MSRTTTGADRTAARDEVAAQARALPARRSAGRRCARRARAGQRLVAGPAMAASRSAARDQPLRVADSARPVARLTEAAVTPGTAARARSTRPTQEAQDRPATSNAVTVSGTP